MRNERTTLKKEVSAHKGPHTVEGSQTYREHTKAYKVSHRSLSREFSEQNPKESVSSQVGENKELILRKTIEVQIPRQHLILGLLCDHAKVDSKGYIVCIRNLEFPAYCLPENCVYLQGVLEDGNERDC